MDKITTLLTENYIYVIGGGLILLIMLIGLISGKNKKKAVKEDKTVDFKDVKTGSITDVMNESSQPAVTPVEVAAEVTPVVESPVVEIEQSTIEMPMVEPILEPVSPVEVESPAIEIPMGMEIGTAEIPNVQETTPVVDAPAEEVVDIVDPLAEMPTTEANEPLVDYVSAVNNNQEENKISE